MFRITHDNDGENYNKPNISFSDLATKHSLRNRTIRKKSFLNSKKFETPPPEKVANESHCKFPHSKNAANSMISLICRVRNSQTQKQRAEWWFHQREERDEEKLVKAYRVLVV